MQKNLWKGLFRPENKKLRSNIFLALLAGVLLLAMGKGFFGGEKETPAQAETQTASDVAERETETRMAEILSKVQGAGAVDVMLTYCRTEERTIAQDEVREESERDGKFRVEQKAVLTEEKGGNTAPFILSENAPRTAFVYALMGVHIIKSTDSPDDFSLHPLILPMQT